MIEMMTQRMRLNETKRKKEIKRELTLGRTEMIEMMTQRIG